MIDQVQPKSSYDVFLDTIKKYKELATVAFGVGTIGPFVAQFVGIIPPYPPGMAVMTAVVELLAMMLAFQFLYHARRRTASAVILASATMLIVAASTYILLFSLFTYLPDGAETREVRGFECRQWVEETYPGECPEVSPIVLANAEYEAETIWTTTSVQLMRAALALSWMSSFIFLALTFSSFIVFQSGQPPKKASKVSGL